MDLVLKLRELRKSRNLSQQEVAKISGVGWKTISSFESGKRIESMKLSQLRKILAVYGVSEAEFFGGAVDLQIEASVPQTPESEVMQAIAPVVKMPRNIQRALAQRIGDIVHTAEAMLQ